MRRTLFPLFLLATSLSASAQTSLLEVGNADPANPWITDFSSVESAGDVDGDGVRDLVVSTLAKVTVHSGANGSVLHTFTEGAADFPLLIQGIYEYPLHGIAAFDVDGDQHDDIAVASPLNPETGALDGAIRIYSGADGAVLRTLTQPHGYALGFGADHGDQGIDCGGDLDLDGFPDLVAVAPHMILAPPFVDTGAHWRGVAFSGFDGSVLTYYEPSQDYYSDLHEMMIAVLGDSDLDGFQDVGVSFDIHLERFRGHDGLPLSSVLLETYMPYLWGSLDAVGDVNGDGRGDFAVIGWLESKSGYAPGEVSVFSGADASLIVRQQGSTRMERLADLDAGDFDRDGVPDLIVGEPEGVASFAPSLSGQVHVFVAGMQRRLAAALHGTKNDSRFGSAVASLGDLDLDGADDVAILETGEWESADDDAVHVVSPAGCEPEPFSFIPGSRVTARLTEPDDIDQAEFEGVTGMRLSLKVGLVDQGLHVLVTIVDPDGAIVGSWQPKAAKLKKIFKLHRNGTHRLVVSSAHGSLGAIRFATQQIFTKPIVDFPPRDKFGYFYKSNAGPIVFDIKAPKGFFLFGPFQPVSNIPFPIPMTLRAVDTQQVTDLTPLALQHPAEFPISDLTLRGASNQRPLCPRDSPHGSLAEEQALRIPVPIRNRRRNAVPRDRLTADAVRWVRIPGSNRIRQPRLVPPDPAWRLSPISSPFIRNGWKLRSSELPAKARRRCPSCFPRCRGMWVAATLAVG